VLGKSAFWLALLLTAILAAVLLYPDMPQGERRSVKWYPLALLTVLWAGWELWHSVLVWRLSKPKVLQATAKRLWHPDDLKRRSAMLRLGFVLGHRFGLPAFPFGRAHQDRCKLWQAWWECNHERLIWNRRLSVYVNPEDFI